MTKVSLLTILLSLLYLSVVISAVCQGDLFKLPLDLYPSARCLDGSPGAFYMQLVPGSQKWLFSLEGGGECIGTKDCTQRSTTDLGSSNKYQPTMNLFGLQSCDSTNNFIDFNKIYLKYCSGDLFFGQDVSVSARVPNLQFSGYQIAKATIDYLFDNHQLSSAQDIILSGLSAGGLGVVGMGDELLDYYHLKLSTISTLKRTNSVYKRLIRGVEYSGPKVAIVPIAGYHFETNPIYIQKTPTDPQRVGYIPWKFEPDWRNYLTFWNATVSHRCVEQGKWRPYECLIAQANYETSPTPWFVIQSTIDSVVLPLHGGCPTVWKPDASGTQLCNTDDAQCPGSVKAYMQIWHGNMTNHIAPVKTKHIYSLFRPDLLPPSTTQIPPGQDASGKEIGEFLANARFGWNTDNGIMMDGAFAAACLVHTEFALTSPMIDNLNYRNALWGWYNETQIYTFKENPHFHLDECPPGSVLCGQCKK